MRCKRALTANQHLGYKVHPTSINMYRNTLFLTALALGLITSATLSVGAPDPVLRPTFGAPGPSYTVTEIASGQNFEGNYMNARGEIAGMVPGPSPGLSHAAVYRDGKIIDLGALLNPAIDSEAQFVSLEGEVFLTTFTGGEFGFKGYVYKHGRFTILKFPPGAAMNEFAGINDFGQAVGNFLDPTATNGGSVSGFIREPDGAFVKLPIIPLFGNYCINDFGQIIGDNRTPGSDTAVLREPGGRLVQLGFASAAAINQRGHVAGYDDTASNVFLYARGKVTNLGHLPGLPATGGTAYFPTALNDFDTVVGVVEAPNTETGFIYVRGQMYDLTKLISPQNGFIVNFVQSVLDNGQILASGGFSFPDDVNRTVVLTPRFERCFLP